MARNIQRTENAASWRGVANKRRAALGWRPELLAAQRISAARNIERKDRVCNQGVAANKPAEGRPGATPTPLAPQRQLRSSPPMP